MIFVTRIIYVNEKVTYYTGVLANLEMRYVQKDWLLNVVAW